MQGDQLPFSLNSNPVGRNQRQKLNQLLAEFSRQADELESSDEIYRAFDRAISELVDYDRMVIQVVHPESRALAEVFDSHSTGSGNSPFTRTQPRISGSQEVILPKEPILVRDCTDPSTLERFPHLGKSAGKIASLVSVPLRRRNSPVGSMLLTSSNKNSFSSREVRTLEMAAAHLTNPIMQLLKFRVLEEELQESATLAEIGRVASSTVDINLIWEDLAKAVQGLMPCDRLVLAVLNEHDEVIEQRCAWGVALPDWDDSPRKNFKGSPAESTLESKTGRIVPIDEIDSNSQERIGYRISEKTGLHSSMMAALVTGKRAMGTLIVKALPENAYTSHHLALFELVAAQIGGSVAASELYTRSVKHSEELAARGELESKNKRLVEASETRSRFIAAITHELRTPLTSIVAAADRLAHDREHPPGEKSALYLDMITRNSKRLHGLIESLLDLSDIESDELWLSGMEFTLYGAVKDAIAAIQPIADTKFQRLVTEFPGIETVINADRERMVQIMENLLSNGCKYSPDYKEIKLKVELNDNEVKISVIDQGDGIPEDDLELVFDEFSRLDNAVTKANTGRGLGLSISRKLARAMGGDVTVSSEVGKGSEFTLTMPVEIAEAA